MTHADTTAPAPSATPAAAEPSLWARIRQRPRVFLVLLCLAFYLPGLFSMPPLDRDESRFAQASKQMLESGDFVNISFLEGMRNKKPAGIHWMQSVTASLAGGPEQAGIWAYRLPSVIGAITAILLLFWAGRRLFGDETALLASALMASAMGLTAEANISKTDGVLIATVIAMQAVLIRYYLKARGGNKMGDETPSQGLAVLFWAALGLSILVKGPIAPMVVGLTIAGISLADRDWTWLSGLRWKMGVAIVAVMVLPWGIAILLETNGVYYQESIGKDLTAKVLSVQESHGGLPGYYLALVTITFFPGSLFMWPALAHAWTNRVDPAIRYCLAWLIPSWIVFEIVPTKLPHYTLPTYPAIALLTAAAIMLAIRAKPEILSGRIGKINIALWTLVGLVIALAATVLPIQFGAGLLTWTVPLSIAGGGLVLTAALFAWRENHLAAVRTAIAAAFVLFVSLLELTLPNLKIIAVSPRITAALEEHYGEDHLTWPRVASTGYVEPSLVFLTATQTRLVKAETAALHLSQTPDGVALVETRKEPKFQARAAELGLTLEQFDEVTGHNYSNGLDVEIHFYRLAGQARSE